jgi:hypothetical protein
MVPKFCRGCSSKLGVMERVYCARAGCQEQARGVASLGSMPKNRLLEMIDIVVYRARADRGDASKQLIDISPLMELRRAVKSHPWEDCSSFLARYEAIKNGSPIAPAATKVLGRIENGRTGDVSGVTEEIVQPDCAKPEPQAREPRTSDSSIELHGILGPYAEAYLAATATEVFRGRQLMISPDVEDLVSLLSITVGVMQQHVGPTPGKSLRGRLLELDTASPGITIILKVKNESGRQIHFRATLFGTTLR